MKILAIMMLALLVIAGCKFDSTEYNGATFVFKTYGGFTPIEDNIRELTIEPGKVTMKIMAFNGSLTRQFEKQISKEQYDKIVKVFKDNDFMSFKDKYVPSGQNLVADAANADIIVKVNGKEKKVTIEPFVLDFYPEPVKKISEELSALAEWAMQQSQDSDPEKMARDFILQGATYDFDGSDLSLVDAMQLESFPVQHVFVYKFTSSHSGYGDRGGKPVAEVITPHEIKITVVSGELAFELRSAVIDGIWDEINQREVIQTTSPPEEPVSNNDSLGSDAWLTFSLMQCEKTPWNAWYESGAIQYVQAPTERELAVAYYGQVHNITVLDYERIDEQIIACQACGVCPTGTSYRIAVDGPDREKMLSLNWTIS